LTYRDIRTPMHLNLHGEITNAESLSDFTIKIYRDDQFVTEINAAVSGDVWNAFWPFAPGELPQEGKYRLELSLTDTSGKTTNLSETIQVNLHSSQVLSDEGSPWGEE